jgi:hypothetical protein
MKRLFALLGILVLVGAIAVPVLAHGPGWGRGGHMGWGGGPVYGHFPSTSQKPVFRKSRCHLNSSGLLALFILRGVLVDTLYPTGY